MAKEERLKRIALYAVVLSAWSGGVSAQSAGDAVRGHTYATMACAACHSIEATGAPSPNANAPVWVDIANTSGMTATALRVFLSTPHQRMPDLIIAPSDLQDLVAYILTLKRVPPI
jgi:mono/diheme cytochrome c family protein